MPGHAEDDGPGKARASSAEMVRNALDQVRGSEGLRGASDELVRAARTELEARTGLSPETPLEGVFAEALTRLETELDVDLGDRSEITSVVQERVREKARRVTHSRRRRREMPPPPAAPSADPSRKERTRTGGIPVLLGVLAIAGLVSSVFRDTSSDSDVEVVPATTAIVIPVDPDTTIGFYGFVRPNGLRFVGAAGTEGPWLRLTPSVDSLRAGAAWFEGKQDVANGFETVFWFRLSEVGESPGDGFAFVVQNSSATALGEPASGVGYAGIPNSVAIEFDTWSHVHELDQTGEHVAVHTAGIEENTAHGGARIGSHPVPGRLADGDTHKARIRYEPGTLDVYLDDAEDSVLSVAIDIDATLDLEAGTAWVGFTASTEPSFRETHDIIGWLFGPLR